MTFSLRFQFSKVKDTLNLDLILGDSVVKLVETFFSYSFTRGVEKKKKDEIIIIEASQNKCKIWKTERDSLK